MSICRTCRAPIVWAQTFTGRRMPLDLHPTDDGSYTITDGLAVYAPDADAPRYRPHWASCPHADQHRKSRR